MGKNCGRRFERIYLGLPHEVGGFAMMNLSRATNFDRNRESNNTSPIPILHHSTLQSLGHGTFALCRGLLTSRTLSR